MKKLGQFFKELLVEKIFLFLFLYLLFLKFVKLGVFFKKEFSSKIRLFLLVNLALSSFAVLSSDLELKEFQQVEQKQAELLKASEVEKTEQAVIKDHLIKNSKEPQDQKKEVEQKASVLEKESKNQLEPLTPLQELKFLNNLHTTKADSNNSLSEIEFLWRASFQIQSFSDETTTNGVVSTRIYGDLKWDLTEQFEFQSQALFIGRNGFTQSIYDREDRSRGLYLLESFFEWRSEKDSPFSFQFGNIDQSFLQAPLLMADRTFPSLILNYLLEEFYNFKSHFLIQTSIPDNAEESVRRESQVIKGFPSFSVLSVYLENSQLPLFSEHYFFNRLTFFHYYNLSQAVAKRSRIYENTIEYTGSDSTFRYDYYGFHNHIKFEMVLSHFFAGEMGFEYLNNLGANYYLNEGYRFYTGLSYNYKDFLEWKGVLQTFVNQSDSSVAYYNSEFYGHNGRRGFAVQLECYLYESGVRVGVSFVNTRSINKNDMNAIGPSNSISLFLTTNQIKI